MSEIIAMLIILSIGLLVFLAMRAIMLWYWKIDIIIENQEKQTAAMKAILQRMMPSDELTNEEKAQRYDRAQ